MLGSGRPNLRTRPAISATVTITAAEINALKMSQNMERNFLVLVVGFFFEVARVRCAINHTGHRTFVLLDNAKLFMRADEP